MAQILIVDDARFIRQVLSTMLVRGGHKVVGEAANGVQAVALYQELRPDLVTIDLTMPEMDGIEAMQSILKIDPDARVIVCSAVNAKTKVIKALQSGARDFILKPVKAERVLEAIDRVLAQPARSATSADRLRTAMEQRMAGVAAATAPESAPAPEPQPAPAPDTSPAGDQPPKKILPWRMQNKGPASEQPPDPAG